MPETSEKWTWTVFGLWLTITVGMASLMYPDGVSLEQYISFGPAWNVISAALVLLVFADAWGWSATGFNPPRTGLALRLSWLPLLILMPVAGTAVANGLPPSGTMLIILVNCLFVGLSEECMFRGILLRMFARRWQLWGTAIATSFCFGLVHSLNAVLTGDLHAAMVQPAVAFMMGFYFHALRLRTGSLVGPILLHALWDFVVITFSVSAWSDGTDLATAATRSLGETLLPLAFGLPLLLLALFMLRRMPNRDLPA